MNNKFLLPIAKKNILGAIKVGAGLSIEKDGTLNVTDVSDAISLVREGKQMIADAVTEKGVATEPGATFEEMAGNVRNIKSSTYGPEFVDVEVKIVKLEEVTYE